jgi:hypothetical protein
VHASPAPHRTPGGLRLSAVKVPAVTAVFWAIKVVTTGTGEAAADGLAAADSCSPSPWPGWACWSR